MTVVALNHQEFNPGREGTHYTPGWDDSVNILSHSVRPGGSGPCPTGWACSKRYCVWM